MHGGRRFRTRQRDTEAQSCGGTGRSVRSGVRATLIGLLLATLGSRTVAAETAACRPEGERGAVRAESCAIAGTDYRLVRARTAVVATVDAAIDLFRDPAGCTEWQAVCVEQLFLPAGAAHRSTRHLRSGEGFTRRVIVSRDSWWRLPDGAVVADLTGDDQLAARFEGTRVLCLRERWTFAPLAGGRTQVTAEVVSDPQPPFGLTGLVTSSTADSLLQALNNFAVRIRSAPAPSGVPLATLPTLPAPLPDLGASFASCQHARRR